VGKWFFGDTSKETIIEIPDGQLYIVRPLSPKGYSELIYKDAQASIRRTGAEFQYQLVITRVFEQGEEELLEESGDEADPSGLASDEQSFLLDEAIQFRVDIRDTGEKVFAWRDLSGASGDLWEFVCETSTKPETVEAFELSALGCQYERKYKKSSEHASEDELLQFLFSDEPIPPASPQLTPSASHAAFIPVETPKQVKTEEVYSTPVMPAKASNSKAPATQKAKRPEALEVYTKQVAELHKFDFTSDTFVLQETTAVAVVTDVGKWSYWLEVSNPSNTWISRSVDDNLSPVFNFEYLSAIFNVESTEDDGSPVVYSWLLRFKDVTQLEAFQAGLMKAIWEHNNQTKWVNLKDNDQDYIMEAFQDLQMTDALEEEEEESEEEDHDNAPRHASEEYDSDESFDDESKNAPKDGNVNSQLAVGHRHDRAFVVRGSKIGVFKHNDDNQLQFVTNISKVQTPKGKLFSPTKVMLHGADSNMILQNADNPNAVYRLDLEAGKVVDEWKVSDDVPINTFAPESVS
jgi:hypothetical protein